MNNCLVVCSEHFLPEDTRPNQRRVKSGAVPTIMAPVIQEELKVCRVCLALDVKMYNMRDFELSEMFQNITGISVFDKNDGILQRVCWECAARLIAAAAFREKALLSDALLNNQVHIKESDIVLLKQNYSYLKSRLAVITVFTSSDIECGHTISKNNEIDNILIPNDTTVINDRKTKIRVDEKEMEVEEYEPLIDVPVKTEVESDPIADNNTGFQDRKTDNFFELTHFNDSSSREDSEDEMTNTEILINCNDKMLIEDTQNIREDIQNITEDTQNIREDTQNITEDTQNITEDTQNITKDTQNIREDTQNITEDTQNITEDTQNITKDTQNIREDTQNITEDTQNKVPVTNDNNISLVEANDNVEKKPKLDGIGNIVDESSSEEDTLSPAEAVSGSKFKHKMSSKVGIKKEGTTIRSYESLKEKIIALKKRGLSVPAIAKETGTSITSIHGWLRHYNLNVTTYHRSSTLGRDQTVMESDSEQDNYHNCEAGKEMAPCSATVRRRLRLAGFEDVLMEKPESTVNMGQNISKHKELHDYLKQRIIALKQKGLSNRRTAYLLNTTRMTVGKWWNRWCDEGHMNNHKGTGTKRKTTPEEDKQLIERVAQEQTIHTPSLAKELGVSVRCVRDRLREAGFQHKERKASVPLRSGRCHKVDKITKQQIIAMKHNGVSVTDIANQFRVTRTSVYLWWRRWCKENNIKITSDKDTNTTAEQKPSLAEHTNNEEIVQTPPILSSKKTVWQKLPDVEFVS